MAVITRWSYKRGGRKAGFHCILVDSVTEMTSGNLVHGSCMVTHGSGNGGNAKWPDKICEWVRVNSGLNCKMETRTIKCVAFFYHEGTKGDDFIQKNKFRCCADSSQWGSVVKPGEHVQ